MTIKQFAALLGFGFAAVWITLGLGDAVLCLAGAAVFAAGAAVVLGEIDLAELQARLGPERGDGFPSAPAPGTGTGAPRARRVR